MNSTNGHTQNVILAFLFACLLCTFSLFSLTSCSTGNNLPLKNDKKLNVESFNEINGFYEYYAIGYQESWKKTIWEDIIPFTRDTVDLDKTASIKIEVKENSTMTLTLYVNSSPVQTKILRYEIEANKLICKQNWTWEGFPLIFYRQRNEVLTFEMDSDKNLEIGIKGRGSGGIFIFIFGADLDDTLKYRKKSV